MINILGPQKGVIANVFRESIRSYRLVMYLSSIALFLSLGQVVYMKVIYGPVINSSSYYFLIESFVFLVFVLVITGYFDYLKNKILISEADRIERAIFIDLLSAVFKDKDNKKIHPRTAVASLNTVSDFMRSPTFSAIFDIPISAFFLFLVYDLSVRLGIFSTLSIVTLVGLNWMAESRNSKYIDQYQKSNIESQEKLLDLARNHELLLSMGVLNRYYNQWKEIKDKCFSYSDDLHLSQITNTSITKFIMLFQGSLIVGLGCWLLINGHVNDDGSYLIVASILSGKAAAPFTRLIQGYRKVSLFKDSMNRLVDFFDIYSEDILKMDLPAPKGRLVLERVVVRDSQTKYNLLRDVSFELPPGRLMLVLGKSGSGKSTLARTIVGIHTPISGRVRMDGFDIGQWDKEKFGRYLGYLPQDIQLFHSSIAENVCRFNEVDQKSLLNALALVGIKDKILSMPEGFNTYLKAEGMGLSGGERQKLGIARAIYGFPRLIVLDEPTANLDEESKEHFIETINKLKEYGSTIVLITHDESLVPYSDRLLIMSAGAVKSFGVPSEVIKAMSGGVDK